MTDQQIIQAFADKMVAQLKAATPKASGKTAEAIHAIVTDTGFEIITPPHLTALIDGRGPSKSQGGSLYKSILEWVKTKCIIPKEPKLKQESLAYVIAKKIHEEGTLLYRKGGDSNSLLAKTLNNTDYTPLLTALAENNAKNIRQEISDVINN